MGTACLFGIGFCHQRRRSMVAMPVSSNALEMCTAHWHVARRNDRRAAALADRHYSRKTVGHPEFTPPGRCLVLLTAHADALWVSCWPSPEYATHSYMQEEVWTCTLFRNEAPQRYLSSALITQAVAATRWKWGQTPQAGMVTFVDPGKVRRKRDWGRCFRKAGWRHTGYTRSGLVVLQISPQDMPPASPAVGQSLLLFADDLIRQGKEVGS
jgi:hypothetical protein